MKMIKILTKLLVVRHEMTRRPNDSDILNAKALQVLNEVIETVSEEVEMRQQFEDECG